MMNNSALWPYAAASLTAIGAGFLVWVFLLTRKLRAVRKALARTDGECEALAFRVNAELEAIKERLALAEDRTGVLVPPPPTRSGLNLAKRAQVMRMLGRGTDAATVAAVLSLPAAEVALLAKIRILATSAQGGLNGSAVSPRGRSGLFRAPDPAPEESSD